MKRLQKFASALVILLLLCGAFAYGQHVSRARMVETLRQAHLVASGDFGAGGPLGFGRYGSASSASLLPAAAADPGVGARMSQTPAPSGDDSIDDYLSSDSPIATFQQVYLLLKDQYVDKIPSDSPLAHGASEAILDSLDDANSRFLNSDERAALEQQANGIYQGTGIVFTVRRVVVSGVPDRQVTVIDVLPGSPAAKAGLQTGDVITSVDGHWIIGYDPFEAQAKMLKRLSSSNDDYDWNQAVDAIDKHIEEGVSLSKAQSMLDTTQTKPVSLQIERAGIAKPLNITLDCSTPTTVKDVDTKQLDGGKSYIRIDAFTNTTSADFAAALSSLKGSTGIVLDLRDCPGGLLDPAVAIARSLSPDSPLGELIVRDNRAPKTAGAGSNTAQSSQVETPLSDPDEDVPKPIKFGTRTETLRAPASSPEVAESLRTPLAVLVNKGTANTAELLATFLRDRLGASIIGSATFGDAMAQTLFPLSDGSGFTLTTGMLKTDNGKPFNISGISLDDRMKDAGQPGSTADPGLREAMAVLDQKPLATAQARD